MSESSAWHPSDSLVERQSPPMAFGLPAELIEAGVHRLGIVSLGLAGTLAAVLGLAVVLRQTHSPGLGAALLGGGWGYVVAGTLIVASLAVAALSRANRWPPTLILDLGMLYAVAASLGIALLEHLTYWPSDDIVRGVSWVCLWIVLFPVMVPATPGKTLLTVLSAAAMGPLAYTVLLACGFPTAGSATLMGLFLPNAAAAALAMVVTRAFYRLGQRVSEARQMGNYQLEECLGRGGMGEVWRARHQRLGRGAAVKVVRPDRTSDPVRHRELLMRRFEREAAATAQLRSPHTVELYDFGIDEAGTLYYVMELLAGIDLDILVRKHGPLPPGRVVHLARQACHSLAEAHAMGLIHRDIKPANLFLSCLGWDGDFLKVLDFGMVRAIDDRIEPSLTGDGAIVATPAYLAPEIALSRNDVDGRSDLYSLGCVIYTLLTGAPVFRADTAVKVLMAHIHEPPIAPSQCAEQPIPEDLEAVTLACLAKEPSKRPASARDLSERLAACSCARNWSNSDALSWWREHLPEQCAVAFAGD